jgi:hypothetical protein
VRGRANRWKGSVNRAVSGSIPVDLRALPDGSTDPSCRLICHMSASFSYAGTISGRHEVHVGDFRHETPARIISLHPPLVIVLATRSSFKRCTSAAMNGDTSFVLRKGRYRKALDLLYLLGDAAVRTSSTSTLDAE